VEVDQRVPGFLGRVLDGSAQPVGTCFQVIPGVLVTAWHVLDDLRAGDVDAMVRVDPLQGGEPRQARVHRIDPVHDLAVLSATEPLVECAAGLAVTDDVELDTRVSITGAAHVEDPGHSHQYLDASGEWRGGTTRHHPGRPGTASPRCAVAGPRAGATSATSAGPAGHPRVSDAGAGRRVSDTTEPPGRYVIAGDATRRTHAQRSRSAGVGDLPGLRPLTRLGSSYGRRDAGVEGSRRTLRAGG